MRVLNVHERELEGNPEQIGALIDSLASREDALWPRHSWPKMEFDRPLGVGADGGHGPIRYFVEEYAPGQSIKFHFTGPKGFSGFHGYEVVRADGKPALLRHTLKMTTHGLAVLSWPVMFRPMHDALIEDSLATAQASLGQRPQVQVWSLWVKLLRWVVSGGKARSQVTPGLRRGALTKSTLSSAPGSRLQILSCRGI
ncbi:MAG TPA: SRPBCC family protein [Thermoanaerobaculia bacterium]